MSKMSLDNSIGSCAAVLQYERFFISVLAADGEEQNQSYTMMGSLPYDRLQIAPAFSKVGVDFFGLIKVKHLRKQQKRYGCLFTCLVTRAIHLDVAFSLFTDCFNTCLRRFIVRRGKPTVIYSDNRTNFVGANRELRVCNDDWNQDTIGGVLSQEGIQWVFNPPATPEMGSVWERLMRSCKKAVDVVLQN